MKTLGITPNLKISMMDCLSRSPYGHYRCPYSRFLRPFPLLIYDFYLFSGEGPKVVMALNHKENIWMIRPRRLLWGG